MVFDPSTAFLRYVRLRDREILRGIFGAVRNRNWDTVGPDVEHVQVREESNGFTVTFEALCCDGDVDFAWRGEVTGASDGSVRYRFEGEARAPFMRNRIGLCVLHPVRECAGQPCRVGHVDGRVTEGAFPLLIAPHQPFKAIRSISHEVEPGLRAVVAFEGDVFEMEDQRNWTDGSFKTYSTPLHLPFPVRIEPGMHIRQSVRLELEEAAGGRLERTRWSAAGRRPAPASAHVRIDWAGRRIGTPIGFGTAAELGDTAQLSLAALQPDHIRVDLQLSSSAWRDRMHEAARVARRAGARLHPAIFLTDAGEQELEAVRDEVAAHLLPIGLWLVFHSSEKVASPRWVELARRVLGDAAPLAAGTNAYFAELNRNRPPADMSALPCFSINPQVHAFDDRSLIETLEVQRSTVETARSFCPRPVVISPITLRPRFNPNATDAGTHAPPESDPRQSTAFGAVWTLGTLARLATSPDVHSLTFFETSGPRGVMDGDGRLYPMGHVFAALAGWRTVADTVTDAPAGSAAPRPARPEPLRVAALALQRDDGARRVLLAGLDTDPVHVVLDAGSRHAARRLLTDDRFGPTDTVRAVDGTLNVEVPPVTVVMLELDPGDNEGAGPDPHRS
jgi:D-apionolactonase